MDKCNKTIARSFLWVMGLMALSACDTSPEFEKISGNTMGTTYHITTDCDVDKEKVDSVLNDFSSVFSTYINQSFISKFNAAKDTTSYFELGPRHKHYESILSEIGTLYDQSYGAFNPYAAKLFDAWGFSEKAQLIIDDIRIDSLLAFSKKGSVEFKNHKLRKLHPYAKLNLNAVAKGYGVDVVAAYLKSQGCENFLIEIGGELVAHGVNMEGLPWKIGVRKPEKGSNSLMAEADLENMAMATSGNYENFKSSGDSTVGHTIDPRTGYPAKSRVLSSTVFAKDCLTADALATACMVMGEGEAIKMIEEAPGVECYLVYIDKNTGKQRSYVSLGMRSKIKEIQ